MEQHRGRGDGKYRRCLQLRGKRLLGGQGVLDLGQGMLGPLDLPDGQIGIGVDQAGRKTQGKLIMGKIQFGDSGGFFRLTAEIIVFGPGDVPQMCILDAFHRFLAMPGDKGTAQKGHGDRVRGRNFFLWICDGNRAFFFWNIGGVWGRGGNGPVCADFLCPGNAAFGAVLLGQGERNIPLFGSLLYGDVIHPVSLLLCWENAYLFILLYASAWTVARKSRLERRLECVKKVAEATFLSFCKGLRAHLRRTLVP